MLDQCSPPGAGEIRVYPIFYPPQKKAAGRQAGVRAARGTGPFWFGDLGLAGKGDSKHVSLGWQSGPLGGKSHHSISGIVISIYFIFFSLVDAHMSVGKGLMISATFAVFFIGTINPDVSGYRQISAVPFWHALSQPGSMGFLRLCLDSGYSRGAHFYFLQPRSPALKALSIVQWFVESCRHPETCVGAPLLHALGLPGCWGCTHSLKACTGLRVQCKHPFRAWEIKLAVALD